MAVIGKLTHLDWFFRAYPALEEARAYMLNALNPTHEIHKRITNLTIEQGEERKEVTYPLSQNIRAIEQTYHLKSAKNAFFETHRAFIDFQLVVEGYEFMRIGDKESFEIQIPYDENRDLIVYNNAFRHYYAESSTLDNNMLKISHTLPFNEVSNTPYRTDLLLRSGDLAIFFPDDTHAGGLELSQKGQYRGQNEGKHKGQGTDFSHPNAHQANPTNPFAQVKKSVLKVPVYLLGLE